MENNYNLRPLWDAILDIYKAIADICERHGIRFYVGAGNCLGALRHKGFIPWDNDMDIYLQWEDYDKFWKYAKEELPVYWKDVGWWNTPEFFQMFGKIQETRKDVVERVEAQSGLKLGQGIFVDVFPLVHRPGTLWQKAAWSVSGFLLKLKVSLVLNKGKRKTLRSKVAGLFGWVFGWAYPSIKDPQSAMAVHERRARKFSRTPNGYCGWYWPTKCDLIIPVPSEYFDDIAYLPYESLTVPVPGNYRGYLKYKYGDYMKLPPENKRTVPNHGHEGDVPWKLGPTGRDVRDK